MKSSGKYEHARQVAVSGVVAASGICRNVQATLAGDALEKKDKSPVTIADYASQAIICRLIRDAFPEDPIVGEEDAAELRSPENQMFRDRIVSELEKIGIEARPEQMLDWIDAGNHDASSSRYWTLDPIDGTKGFLRKEQFAVSLALLIDKRIEVAALACPNLSWDGKTGVVFSAIRGEGAWAVPLDTPDAEPQRVHVSSVADPAQARMCESVESGHSAHDQSALILEKLGIVAPPVRMDSQAKYGAVANGDGDIYLRLPTRPGYEERIWDHAGGVLVVEEAGGRVTDVDGLPLDFSVGPTLRRNRGVVVTNGLLHETVLAALKSLSQPPV
ncbi:3'(2'),5'-bisphosphate nucleotidase [Planctomicrobium sp. SH661]|uniref:3'(2'),5'-bisphosphate nucleotidase n=1 Tax=Planctomicrobium sp. SH661 TaxID=3448124 RepID=UPI003F5BF6D7